MKKYKKILIGIIAALIIMQFYRPNKNLQLEPTQDDFLVLTDAPDYIIYIMENACYDCHSNSTNYEWFDHIAPISWMVDNNIQKGKKVLNFSIWKTLPTWQQLNYIRAVEFDMQTKRMPTKKYIEFHPEAQLSEAQIQSFIDWTNSLSMEQLTGSKERRY